MLPRVPVTCRPLSPAQIYHEFQESALKKKFFFFNSAFYKSYLGDFSFLFKQFYYGKTTLHGIYPLSKCLRVQYVSDCSLVSSSLFQTHGTRPQCGHHPRPAALLVFSASPQLGTCGFRNVHRALHSAQAPRGDLCSHSFLHFCTLKPEKHCDSERGPASVRAHPRRAAPSPPTRPQPHPRLPLCGPRRAAAPSSSPVGLSYTDGQELAARHSGGRIF